MNRRLMIIGRLVKNPAVARLSPLNWLSKVGAQVVKEVQPAMNRKKYRPIFQASRFVKLFRNLALALGLSSRGFFMGGPSGTNRQNNPSATILMTTPNVEW
jgi:hypothetical protein